MGCVDEEYLEIFDGDVETFEQISTKINNKLFQEVEKTKCKHSMTKVYPNGQGFCIDCGVSFTITKCKHENIYEDDNGLYVCRDCHTEIEVFDFDPEWRFYGSSDNRLSKNPERCSRIKSTGRGIRKVFEDNSIDIPNAIISQVEKKYQKVVGNNTVRGKGRKAIIAACLFHVYIEINEFRTSDYIRNLFGLSKKEFSSGYNKYLEMFPKERIVNIKPEDLLRWILTITGMSQDHYRKILKISRYLENSSRLLKRSSPQSVASAIVYFYLCLHPKYKHKLGINKTEFAKKVYLSDITVSKLVKEASEISNCLVSM